MQRRKLILSLVLLVFVAMQSHQARADAQAVDKGKLVITQFYPLKDVVALAPLQPVEVDGLISTMKEKIDPETWQIPDGRNSGTVDSFLVWPVSTIEVDYEHGCLKIRTTVRNHRSIKKYLTSARKERAGLSSNPNQ